jgi:type II secretory pathway pseudopilin PulG
MIRSAAAKSKQANGFTLVELLIGGVLSILAMGSVAFLSVQQIRIADNVYATSTIDRSFRRISDLLKVEVAEACLLRGGANPRTTATLPDTPCKPQNPSVCAPAAAAADLRLLVPVQAPGSNAITYTVIRYYRTGTELLRDGPQVGANGLLTATAATGSRVLTNVSAFSATVSADCTWVRLNLGLTVPGSENAVTRTLDLYSGASLSIH